MVPVKPLRVWTRRAPPILFARHLAAAQPGPRNQPAASWPWVSPSARSPRHRAPAAEPWRRAGGQWQERFPAATAYACPGLKAKEPRVFGGAAELGGAAPPQWQGDVEPLWLSYEANPFTGQPFFNEARALRPALRPYQQRLSVRCVPAQRHAALSARSMAAVVLCIPGSGTPRHSPLRGQAAGNLPSLNL